METEPTIRHKRGDVREDGVVFWQYKSDGNEYWVSPEKFVELRGRQCARQQTDEYRERRRARRQTDEYREYARSYRQTDEYRERRRARQQTDEYRERERARRQTDEYREYKRDYVRSRYQQDPLVATARRLRCRTSRAFRRISVDKPSNTETLLGADWETVKAHIESQFVGGMNWDNMGEWHIDHIVPLASAKTEEELCALCHYTNLQPLFALDNIRKGAKLPAPQ